MRRVNQSDWRGSRPSMRKSSIELLAFHTGLLAIDYYRFPPPPYVGNGWHLDLVEPPRNLQIGSAIVDDERYPAKEVVVRASSEVSAQRAADLIHAARLVLDGSNYASHLYPGEHAPIYPVSTDGVSTLKQRELGLSKTTNE